MLSVAYPSHQMYVPQHQPQKAYYVQQQVVAAPAAGQWATTSGTQWVSVAPSALAGGNYVYATTPSQHQPHHQPQRPPMATVIPPGYSLVTAQPQPQQQQQRVRAPSTYGPQQARALAPIPAPVRSQSYPPTVLPARPPMQRKISSVSLHQRRPSMDAQEGIVPDADDLPVPASPVFSESTISSSGSSSSGSSMSSHLNLSRSAMNHYTAPQRSRRLSVSSRGYDPLANRSQLSLPPPPIQGGPHQIAAPPINAGPVLSTPPQPQPNFVRPPTNSTRPVSFHEDCAPVYSSYELYQPGPGSRPPTSRPPLGRRPSSRSLSGAPELGPSSYGASIGMGGPSMGMYGGEQEKRKWWKGGR